MKTRVPILKPENSIVLGDMTELGIREHSFTIEAWAWFEQPGFLFGGSGGTTAFATRMHLVFGLRTASILAFYAHDTNGSAPIGMRTWVHLAFRYDKARREQAIFVNGILDGRTPNREPYLGTGQLLLGSPFWEPFSGRVSDVRVWNIARTEEEIRTTLWQRLTGREGGLTCYRRLDADDIEGISGPAPQIVEEVLPLAEVGENPRTGVARLGAKAEVPNIVVTDWLAKTVQARGTATGLTIEAWVRQQPGAPGGAIVSSLGRPSGAKQSSGWVLMWHGGVPRFLWDNGDLVAGGPVRLDVNDWVHVAATHDHKTMRIYCNGVQVFAEPKPGKVEWAGANELVFGACADLFGEGRFSGAVADVRIWNKARTHAEIQGDFIRRLDGKPPGLVAYYPLDFADIDDLGTVVEGTGNSSLNGVAHNVDWTDAPLPPPLSSGRTAEGFYRGLAKSGLDRYESATIDLTLKTTALNKTEAEISGLRHDIAQVRSTREATIKELEAQRDAVTTMKERLEQEVVRLKAEKPQEITSIDTLYEKAHEQIQTAREKITDKSGYRLGPVSIELKYFATQDGHSFGAVFPKTKKLGVDGKETGPIAFDDNVEMTVHRMEFLPPAPTPAPPVQKVVPDLLGYTTEMATRKAADAGFAVEALSQLIGIPSQDRQRAGTVVNQVPGPGAIVESSAPSVVKIFIGKPGIKHGDT